MYPGRPPDLFEKWLPARAALAPTDVVSDTEPEGAVFMPVDVIVGRRAPRIGVALRQKP